MKYIKTKLTLNAIYLQCTIIPHVICLHCLHIVWPQVVMLAPRSSENNRNMVHLFKTELFVVTKTFWMVLWKNVLSERCHLKSLNQGRNDFEWHLTLSTYFHKNRNIVVPNGNARGYYISQFPLCTNTCLQIQSLSVMYSCSAVVSAQLREFCLPIYVLLQ